MTSDVEVPQDRLFRLAFEQELERCPNDCIDVSPLTEAVERRPGNGYSVLCRTAIWRNDRDVGLPAFTELARLDLDTFRPASMPPMRGASRCRHRPVSRRP
jgi:hypothetical protein